jgi:predicted RNase H-like nuclease (RuvC/YqgF family)
MIDWATLLPLITVLGGGAGISAIILAILNRKKLNADSAKTKADTASVIEEAAGKLIERYRDHNTNLIQECVGLKSESDSMRAEIETLKGRVDENETCQTTLKRQIESLEAEKRGLIKEVGELKTRIEELEKENLRLKLEKEQQE